MMDFIDFTTIVDHINLVVLLACLGVGYVIKQWIKDIDNKYIPTINFFLGAILNMAIDGFTIEIAVYGAFTGLVSVGLYEMFKNFVEGKKEAE